MSGATASLWALCLGNFVIGTGTLIVPGMLPALAEGIGVSLPLAGQLITAFAAAVCIGAPLLASATSRYDRRALLVATLVLFAIGHVSAALLSSFAPMLITRVITAAGAALFTAQAAAVAALLVPPQARGRAIAFVFLGWSVASVLGVPLGAYIGATLGWRAGFAVVALASAAVAAALWLRLPAGLHVKPVNAATWRMIAADGRFLSLLGVTALFMAAGFALFSYFVPAVHALVGASPALVSILLGAFGVAAVTGNALAARYMDRFGAGTVTLVCLAAMALGHLLWPLAAGSIATLFAAVLLWGIGGFAANSAQQTRLAALAPAHASVSIALNTSAVFLGQAAGTAAASTLLLHVPGRDGFAAIPAISVPLIVLAIGLSLFASLRMRSHSRSAHVQGTPASG
jgi:predicted MFS family arabinose efflux permease